MDAVTALSGSGPAYVYYLMEAMALAGQKAGLDKTQATKLARQTVIGAGALADLEKNLPATILRENVTSPGGTTEAALRTAYGWTISRDYERSHRIGQKPG